MIVEVFHAPLAATAERCGPMLGRIPEMQGYHYKWRSQRNEENEGGRLRAGGMVRRFPCSDGGTHRGSAIPLRPPNSPSGYGVAHRPFVFPKKGDGDPHVALPRRRHVTCSPAGTTSVW